MTTARLEYRNPVHPGYFADPFVLRTDSASIPGYVAYGTGRVVDGRVFEVLVSADLVHWEPVGGALDPPDPAGGSEYWAPEVAERDGQWWMYYSTGHGDVGHSLRVGVADTPVGPFADCRLDLTPHERFAIDPSPFRDDDGTEYLFYARDVLDGDRVGTMLAVDVLESPTRLRGDPRTVLRPSDDWQLFERGRSRYGRVCDWHTLEGPFVVRRGGRYWCFYSGGSWQRSSYAVGVAVAPHPLGPWAEPSPTRRVLETVPGHVLGPGHNSVVVGPNGGDVMVYHAWDAELTARRMCIDPIIWTDDGPVVRGPTWSATDLDGPWPTSCARPGVTARESP
jgi:arabinan endo-1,5-alpha-L-arabinosidase